jgi:hypothetical protein
MKNLRRRNLREMALGTPELISPKRRNIPLRYGILVG